MTRIAPTSLPGAARRNGVDNLAPAHGPDRYPADARGEANARSLGERLKAEIFELVFVSPLSRARRTCELAGFGTQARPEPDLLEWNYGADEGRTTARDSRGAARVVPVSRWLSTRRVGGGRGCPG